MTSAEMEPIETQPSSIELRDPLIVCGALRTGVRLVGALLDSNSGFASGPELPFVVTMAHQWRDLDATLGLNHEKHYGVSREASREAFRVAILKLFAPRLIEMRKPRFVLQSFAAAISLEVFGKLFPAAKFVLMVRDPRDVALSLLRCQWRNPRDGRPLPYTQDVQSGARFWVEFNSMIARSVGALNAPGRLLWVRYEDLCSNPGSCLDRLAKFIDTPRLDPSIAESSAGLVAHSSDEPHPALRVGSLDPASVGRWRTQLAGRDIAAIESITAPLRGKFGYG